MSIGNAFALFGKTRALENKIDTFLDRISDAGLIFRRVVKIYLQDGAGDDLQEAVEHLSETESAVDDLRRAIESQLYSMKKT